MSNDQIPPKQMCQQDDDPFDSLFNLEDHHYNEGYQAGYADGVAQSALEARIFGIEKGFEKFVVMGQLRRQAEVWADMFGSATTEAKAQDAKGLEVDNNNEKGSDKGAQEKEHGLRMPRRTQPSTRLQRHIDTLLVLTDFSALDKSNTDEAVAEFDDRVKRAQAKVKVIEHIVGEQKTASQAKSAAATSSMNDGASATPDIENLKLKPG